MEGIGQQAEVLLPRLLHISCLPSSPPPWNGGGGVGIALFPPMKFLRCFTTLCVRNIGMLARRSSTSRIVDQTKEMHVPMTLQYLVNST
jgi:hypothetical protein